MDDCSASSSSTADAKRSPLKKSLRLSLIYKSFLDSISTDDIIQENSKLAQRRRSQAKRTNYHDGSLLSSGKLSNGRAASKPAKNVKNSPASSRSSSHVDSRPKKEPGSRSAKKTNGNKTILLVKIGAKPKTFLSVDSAPVRSEEAVEGSSKRKHRKRTSYSPEPGISEHKKHSPRKANSSKRKSKVRAPVSVQRISGDEISAEMCYICHDYDCPTGKPDEEDEWIQCSSCPRWFHVFCVCPDEESLATFDPDNFVCNYCSANSST